jgi:hypothetical protein
VRRLKVTAVEAGKLHRRFLPKEKVCGERATDFAALQLAQRTTSWASAVGQPLRTRAFPDTITVIGADGCRRHLKAAVSDYALELGAFVLWRTFLTCIATIAYMLEVHSQVEVLDILDTVPFLRLQR